MRGRDIKRYSYEFADKWIIATFPSRNYNIDDYPAVKDYLLTFGKEKLEQSGKKNVYGIKGNNARKKTNNKWFETQDSIGYWEEFNKQKIAFPAIMTGGAFFSIVPKEYMVVAPGNIITGTNIIPLESFLTSDVCYFALRHFYMGGGIEGELKVNRLLLLPIPLNIENRKHSLHDIQKLYKLTDEEMKFISSSVRSK